MTTSPTSLDRRAFFSLVGTSVGAIVLANCMCGCSAASEDTPGPNPTGTGSGKVNVSLNLNEAANAKLKQNGGFIYLNGLIVARTKDGSFLAVNKACTHAGTSVEYDLAGNRLHCPDHGSNFKNDGSVINGPAGSPLKVYKTSFDGASNVLKINE
ncbi:QcrA and Rieske domain-containing protein [Spirosoma areae]